MRIGFGYDSHRFDASRPLMLGGVRIDGAPGIPSQTTPTHNQFFRSPLQFVPSTGQWIFHHNSVNPNYVRDVFMDSVLQETE